MTVVVLEGDGIGPPVVAEALRVLEAVGFTRPLVRASFGYGCWQTTGVALPDETVRAIERAGVALLGAATTPAEGCASPVLELRRRLGLDLMVRPARGDGIDLVVVGHSFLGLYAEAEDPGPPAVASWVVTQEGAQRLMEGAFARARRKVTLVDKPTVLRGAARIFREAAERCARPGIEYEAINADHFVAALLRRPLTFDVVAATSFVADVISDLSAERIGGVGCAPSASLGPQVAVFEPVHGSAPRRASKRPLRVNPEGAILAAAMMLDHLGDPGRGDRIRAAVRRLREERNVLTPDLGGDATTEAVGRRVAELAGESG